MIRGIAIGFILGALATAAAGAYLRDWPAVVGWCAAAGWAFVAEVQRACARDWHSLYTQSNNALARALKKMREIDR